MPELDERNERIQQLGQSSELVERGTCLREPWVVLAQHAAPLARELERLESAPELGDGLGQVTVLVMRHPLRSLHVERELGGPQRPPTRDLGVGERVVGRVDLDRVEALGVVAQPPLRRRDTTGVPRRKQAFVGPAARPQPATAGIRSP